MRLSEEKRRKISEYILSVLHDKFPESLFTSQIANEIARDEEFTKDLLSELNSKNLVTQIDKNSKGIKYSRRIKWRLSNKAHSLLSNNYK
ncbi:MAG TPA: hypothetical protein VI815_00480 [Candidatus Nanoarchaeia archaeon]|nr:hypothetical protein [Candidatus Nanoarchaeia archaeon]